MKSAHSMKVELWMKVEQGLKVGELRHAEGDMKLEQWMKVEL